MAKTKAQLVEEYVSEHIEEGHALPSQLEAAFQAGFEAGEEGICDRYRECMRVGHKAAYYPGNALDLEPQTYCGHCLLDLD